MIEIVVYDGFYNIDPYDIRRSALRRIAGYSDCLILIPTIWDDYGYYTVFEVYYADNSQDQHHIGLVKIYCDQLDNKKSISDSQTIYVKDYLSPSIERLDNSFCSLGQDLNYYINLKKYLPNECVSVLDRLNDIALFDDLHTFVNKEGVKKSLLRFSSAEKAFHEAKTVIYPEAASKSKKDLSFAYNVIVPYDSSKTRLTFDFTGSPHLPYRINVIVGKNGTGKTQIFSRLADSLSGYTYSGEDNNFENGRPPFDRVMSISYSAFDSFRKPPSQHSRSVFGYVYCGIQSEEGTLSLDQLRKNLEKAFHLIQTKERLDTWKKIVSVVLEFENTSTLNMIQEEQFDKINLSSGQQILICTMTELIANIENESILLFDEPEIHLHPNAVSNVMRMFYMLLEEFNSYAIFATHSPLILQEIPSKYIQILDRHDDMLICRKPEIECFGNNISEIVFEVFDVANKESNYRTHLRNLSKQLSFEQITELFENRLSFNALMYLKSCYGDAE